MGKLKFWEIKKLLGRSEIVIKIRKGHDHLYVTLKDLRTRFR